MPVYGGITAAAGSAAAADYYTVAKSQLAHHACTMGRRARAATLTHSTVTKIFVYKAHDCMAVKLLHYLINGFQHATGKDQLPRKNCTTVSREHAEAVHHGTLNTWNPDLVMSVLLGVSLHTIASN